MNKTKKLLSVLLAVLMILSSMSIMSSAAITQYKTVANLANDGDGAGLDAYSPYGQVTRLSTEERASMVQDFLDNVLPGLNINMGTVFNAIGIKIVIDLTSIDQLCYSVDTIANLLTNDTLVGLAGLVVDLGILADIELGTWQTGMKRANVSQLLLFQELLEILNANASVISGIIKTGELNLGLIGGMIGDISGITDLLGNIPGLIKGLVLPLIERWDDTLEIVKKYDTAIATRDGGVEELINDRVKKLFTDDMSNTTVKYNEAGTMTSEHTKMPIRTTAPSTTDVQTDAKAPRMVYYVTGTTEGSVMTIYHLVDEAEKKALEKDTIKDNEQAAYTYFEQENKLYLEEEVEGNGVYVWKEKNDKGEVLSTLKWYNDNSPLLPGFSGDDFDLRTMSAGDLLYKFIPVVFKNMAPVVLNGSVKKILAEFFGAKFTRIGAVGDDAVNALPDASNAFFTEEQGEYMFEWSDYLVVKDETNGDRHYYRYLDDIYVSDLSATNNYFDIINWNYTIDDNFMNEFVPANDDDASNRLLLNLNNFLIKVAETITVESVMTEDSYVNPKTGEKFTAQWTRPTFVKDGGDTGVARNAKLVENIKAAAQAVIELAPQHIFGSDYETNPRCYYTLLTDKTSNDNVLTGIAATLVDALMPSMTLPTAAELKADNTKVGAILAGVIREFAAYLAPEYNFDALIYADFGTNTGANGDNDKAKTFLSGKDSEYWFDVILTMGINIGFEYLRAFADMGEDTTEWNSFAAYSGYGVDGKTYAAGTTADQLKTEWEGMLDYIIDWALEKDYEWTWKMENLVEVDGLTIDLATAQDPWVKLDKILFGLIPFDEILNITTNDQYPTRIEKFLRYDLILGLVDLRWDALINTVAFNGPSGYFRGSEESKNALDQLAAIIKRIVNGLFDKVGGGSYALLPSAMTDIDSLANQTNLGTLVEGLLTNLLTAYNNGLLDTALPIVNMFLGWHTDAQKLADPQVWETFRDNNDYAFQWTGQTAETVDGVAIPAYPAISKATIHFLNNSAGMLETHRNSDVVDKEYTIEIKNVTSDATVNTLTFDYGDGVASPYETIDIKIGGTYKGEEAVTVTIEYEYKGKDGQPIGGKQYISRTIFFSNQYEDNNVTTERVKVAGSWPWEVGTNAYNKFIFSEDIYTAMNEAQVTIYYKNSVSGSTPKSQYEAPDLCIEGPVNDNGTPDCSKDDYTEWYPEDYPEYDQYAEQYFTYKTEAESGWPSKVEANMITGEGTGAGKFYKAKAEYGADYDFPIGIYAPQACAVNYDGNHIFEQVFIHYDDYDIYELYTANKDNGYNANQGVDAATYKAYNDAWKNVVRLATYPLMTELNNNNTAADYVKVIMPQIKPAMEAFETAKEAYEEALAEAQASGSAAAALPAYVEALRDEIDNDFINGKEINFQDYNFYEYFNYNDVKVAGENIYRGYLAPKVMDKYYIQGSGISEAELDLVMDAEANDFIAAGIAASRLENKQEAIDASALAAQDWKQPVNTKLSVEDVTARMAYYKQFLAPNAEPLSYNGKAAHIYFLEKEIAHIEAQGLVAEDYEAVTWGRFAEALAEAKAVADGTDEFAAFNSRVYDVKYNLMVAYKQLLAKANSLIEAGGTATLNANIDIANAIFASLDANDGVYKLKDGVDANTAYAALISALGYKYQAVYSENDIEVQNGDKTAGDLKYNDDGSPMIFNLYADSALEYSENDRPNKTGNQAKVDAANKALEAAIANFDKYYTVTYTDGVDGEEIFADETYTIKADETTPAFAGSTEREGFEFKGWTPAVADKVTDNVTYVATWEEVASEPNTLVLKEDAPFEAIIDTVNCGDYTGAVYGFDTLGYNDDAEVDGTIADFITTAYGDEYLEVLPTDDGETTGTLINVLDGEGNVVETYVFIYFGDIDGDAYPGAGDAFIAEMYEIDGEGFDELYQFMSGDVDGDAYTGAGDAFVLEMYEIDGEGLPYQADLGAVAKESVYEF